jgi:hypothetical protein
MYRYVILFIPILFILGCLCDPQYCRYPNLFQPGHISEQKDWARKYDPFTDPDMGPKIVGDRPSGALDPTPPYQRFQKH